MKRRGIPIINSSQNTFECHSCGKVFKTRAARANHERSHETDSSSTIPNKIEESGSEDIPLGMEEYETLSLNEEPQTFIDVEVVHTPFETPTEQQDQAFDMGEEADEEDLNSCESHFQEINKEFTDQATDQTSSTGEDLTDQATDQTASQATDQASSTGEEPDRTNTDTDQATDQTANQAIDQASSTGEELDRINTDLIDQVTDYTGEETDGINTEVFKNLFIYLVSIYLI